MDADNKNRERSNTTDAWCFRAIFHRDKSKSTKCCNADLELFQACMKRELGDYKLCKDSWIKEYGVNPQDAKETMFNVVDAYMTADKPGGYCAGFSTFGEYNTCIRPTHAYIRT